MKHVKLDISCSATMWRNVSEMYFGYCDEGKTRVMNVTVVL